MKKFDVAALGSGNIDIFLSIPSLPTRGGKVVGTRLGEQAGGTVANSACAMGQLGLNVVSVSCVGNDHSASIILDGFKKYHVNCDFVQVIPELIANTAIIFIDELRWFTRLVVIMSGIKKKPCRQLRKAVIIIRCQQISRNFVCWPNIPVAR